jgi:hypothetical protein
MFKKIDINQFRNLSQAGTRRSKEKIQEADA